MRSDVSLHQPWVLALRVGPHLRRTKDAGLSPEATQRLRERLDGIDHALAVAAARSHRTVVG